MRYLCLTVIPTDGSAPLATIINLAYVVSITEKRVGMDKRPITEVMTGNHIYHVKESVEQIKAWMSQPESFGGAILNHEPSPI